MTRRMLIVSVTVLALAVMLITTAVLRREGAPRPQPSAFARAVDLSPLGRVAVYEEGKLKSFDSFASSKMHFVSGPRRINGNPDAFSYLDLMLRPEAYIDTPAIYVKNKPMRGRIAEALRHSIDETLPTQLARVAQVQGWTQAEAAAEERRVREALDEQIRAFLRTGLASEQMLLDGHVQTLLELKEQDLIRTEKVVRQIRNALVVKQPEFLRDGLLLVAPAGSAEEAFDKPWMTADALAEAPPGSLDTDPARRDEIAAAWTALAAGWRDQDAARVNEAVAALAVLLPAVNPAVYPDQRRLAWESWYFGAGSMTWVWLIYLLSVVFLLMSVVYRWRAARWLGLGVFGAAFGLQTFALLLRWYVSGRWPNANMFEAVTTAAWFGACLAVVLEVLVRRTPMRNLFALGSAVASMAALMCVHFLPVQLNPNISNRMPVLHDVWLYIHTNVIIFSYCLIAMAAVSAGLYLVYRIGGGKADFVRVGGAGALIMTRPAGGSYLADARTSAGQILDGATMVLMELAFIMLWAGLVMGAIWADHSWGRPWGWDPKEVFALNTFIILALLIHTRLRVRDKGLWTAILAMVGFAVMLFNWIVINFVIVGLHSYA